MSRILIAEDDPLMSSFLEKGLRANGMSTFVVGDGEQAERVGRTGNFDLLILDMGLPLREGLDVLQQLRRSGEALPVLVLTGRPQSRDVVTCLEGGADEYMTKPFRLDELLARVRARLRDIGGDETHVLSAGAVRLDLWTRQAQVRAGWVALTAREFALLETLVRHPGQVLSREQLLSHVWGYDFDPSTNLVTVYVHSLRRKLGDRVIETVRNFGYRLGGV